MPSRSTLTKRPTATARRGGRAGDPKPSLVDRAYGDLKRRILDNELPAGFTALEQEIALMLGISRTPVREALIRLEQEGLVSVRSRHGMKVLPLSPADMRDIYQILTALEASAAELAAKRDLAPEDIARLDDAVADMERALGDDDLSAWAEADDRFHATLVELSGNARLSALALTFRDQSHRARLATLTLRPKPVQSTADHRQLADAIRAGDPHAAREMHRLHRARATDMLYDLMMRIGLSGL